MGFGNPQVPWIELEQRLSDRGPDGRAPGSPPWTNAGGDSPAWSRRRQPYRPPPQFERPSDAVPYAELHCHSNFSFLDGASHAEELVEEAVRLGLEALALTDHNGFYGVVRFAEAARAHRPAHGLRRRAHLGAHGQAPSPGDPIPQASHLLVLARNPTGYARLGCAISRGADGRREGCPAHHVARADRYRRWRGSPRGTGWCSRRVAKARCPRLSSAMVPAAARRALDDLVARFGRDNVVVELWDHGHPLDSARNDALAELAIHAGVEVIATNNVHYHRPSRRQLATAHGRRACSPFARRDRRMVAARRAAAHLRSGAEQAAGSLAIPGWSNAPPSSAWPARSTSRWSRPTCRRSRARPVTTRCRGLRDAHRARRRAALRPSRRASARRARTAQIDHELAAHRAARLSRLLLGRVGHRRVLPARTNIFCQGRGSAANSAVCYALGITNADAVSSGVAVRAVPVARA